MGDLSGPVVIQVGKGYLILSPDWVPDNNLAYIVELIPILIKVAQVPIKWLEFWSTGNGDV